MSHQLQKMIGLHRLGEVVGGPRLDALLPVALHRLGGERDDRQVDELRHLPDGPHRRVPVKFRHHHIHQHQRDVLVALQRLYPGTPVFRIKDLGPKPLEDARESEDAARVVVDDQDPRPVQHVLAVARHGHRGLAHDHAGGVRDRERIDHRRARLDRGSRRAPGRQVQRERAALAQPAGRADLPAEQPGDVAADRQAEPGPAVASAGRPVGLGERVEDRAELLPGYAHAGVGHGERDDVGCAPERAGELHLAGQRDRELDLADRRELDRVGQQVAQDLLEPLLVHVEAVRRAAAYFDAEAEALVFGHRPERGVDVIGERRELEVGGVHIHLARLDLGQVQDVVDQLQQVGPGRVDRAGEVHLLAGEVAVLVLGQQLGEDEQAVQRRAQLVRHVREEVGLVPRRDSQLLGAFLQGLPCLLDLAVLHLDRAVLLGEQRGLLLELRVGPAQLGLLALQLDGALLKLRGEPLRPAEQRLGPGACHDRVDRHPDGPDELVEEREVDVAEPGQRRDLQHAEHLVLEQDRQHRHAHRRGLAESRPDLEVAGGRIGDHDRRALDGRLAGQALARRELGEPALHEAVRGDAGELELLLLAMRHRRVVGEVDRTVLGGRERGQLAEDQAGQLQQVAVALHQARDPGEVGLQPVLLLVGPGCRAQVGDHQVDVVLELGDLAARRDLHRLGQVALGDRAGYGADRAHLRGQVAGQLVDALGQALPGARHVAYLGLAAEPALAADLAGHPGDLRGERGQLVDHGVERGLELEDLAARVDVDLLGQVTVRDGGRDLGDVADLPGQIVRHEVDVVGQVLPHAGDAADVGLAAEPAFGADLAGYPGDFVGERRQLVDHGVDGGLQLEDLAPGVNVDLLGQVAGGDRGGDLGDVADLAGEVVRHDVDVVGEVFPDPGHAADVGLAAEPAFGADLAGYPGDLVGERGQLVDHGVERGLELEDLAARVDVDLLRQVAVGDGGRDLGDVADLAGEVVRHDVDVVGEVFPDPGDAADVGLAAEPAFGADLAGYPGDLVGERGQLVDHGVERGLELEDLAARVDVDLLRQVAVGDGGRDLG